MHRLADLVAQNENWLIQRILHYAKQFNYVKCTSTLEEAWRVSIAGLSKALIEATEAYAEAPELGPDEEFSRDPIAAFGILQAERHRSRGVTLPMFLGLMKYYRQSYVDLVGQSELRNEEKDRLTLYLNRFFDRVELGFTMAWQSKSQSDSATWLQEANRELANEKNKYLTIFQSTPIPLVLIGPNGLVEHVNGAAAELLGLGGKGCVASYSGTKQLPQLKDYPWLAEAAATCAAGTAEEVSFERSIEVAGERRQYTVSLQRMMDVSEKFVGTVVQFYDITEQKQASEQLHKANLKLSDWVGELEVRHGQMALLSEMAEMLQMCADAEEAYGIVGQFMQRAFPSASGALAVMSNSRNIMDTVVSWGQGLSQEKVFEPHACWGLRRGKPYVVRGNGQMPLCRHCQEPLPTRTVCVPLVAQGDTLGLLHLECRHEGDDPCAFADDHTLKLATTLADCMALSLANLKLRETLKYQSTRDPLSGLFNRRYMEETFERELMRAMRRQTPLAVIMLDIDHFKRFNDAHGHDAGDTAICRLAKFLMGRVRVDDVACRYGGEEFLIIMPNATLEEATRRAEALRVEAMDLVIPLRSESYNGLTLSLGVAAWPDHGKTRESLMAAADAALYAAKNAGRNRVATAEPLTV